MYRGIKFYEAAVKATNGDLAREAVAAALDKAKIDQGSGRRRRDGARQDALQDEHVHRAVQEVDAGKTALRHQLQVQHGRSEGMLSAG